MYRPPPAFVVSCFLISFSYFALLCFSLSPLFSSAFDDEQISTALGYVAHLLIMLSKYQNVCTLSSFLFPVSFRPSLSRSHLFVVPSLQIPLRYRILYKASRSEITDDVVQSGQPYASSSFSILFCICSCLSSLLVHFPLSRFPLYFKNTDETRAKAGVVLLNRNIEQVPSSLLPFLFLLHFSLFALRSSILFCLFLPSAAQYPSTQLVFANAAILGLHAGNARSSAQQ
jgi:hypothetical protein